MLTGIQSRAASILFLRIGIHILITWTIQHGSFVRRRWRGVFIAWTSQCVSLGLWWSGFLVTAWRKHRLLLNMSLNHQLGSLSYFVSYLCVKVLIRRRVVVNDFSTFVLGIETRWRWSLIIRVPLLLFLLPSLKSRSGLGIRLVVIDQTIITLVSPALLWIF